ncbi:MAG: UTP--glucose-1-phosphate uridylyltransferase, partial [Thermoguttaceae bacterium]|nr:UTP--glucose-1-phosphate uridylyltransferase [Thermoguttaceae bacterium]
LERPDHLALSPDGHGGMLAALARSGGLEDCRRRGIEHLFYFQVDNPLVEVCGAEFLGYHLLAGSEMTTQVVAKRFPQEKVGNVLAVDGRLRVIEYSDLPDDVAERRAPDGSLAIWAGSIAVHAFDVGFLERMAQSAEALPFHRANKKVPYVDPATGLRVEPKQPNAVKFERFIFDLMPSARNALVVEVDPAEHFAPVKNASGEPSDTPESAKAQMVAVHAAWLARAGVDVAPGVPVEISPLFAMDANELAGKLTPGMRITSPTYFT